MLYVIVHNRLLSLASFSIIYVIAGLDIESDDFRAPYFTKVIFQSCMKI